MSIANQLLPSVIRCAREVEKQGMMVDQRQHGKWVEVPLDGSDGAQPHERTLAWMMRQGLLMRSGSGAGRGLKIDGSVAAVMGMPEYDDS